MRDRMITDLTQLGYTELDQLRELFTAWERQGLPSDFRNEDIMFQYDLFLGRMCITNSYAQTCMLDDANKLKSWYYIDGRCGFAEDLIILYENGRINLYWYEALAEIAEANGYMMKAKEIREQIV